MNLFQKFNMTLILLNCKQVLGGEVLASYKGLFEKINN